MTIDRLRTVISAIEYQLNVLKENLNERDEETKRHIDEPYQKGLHEGNDIGYKDGVNDGRNEAWETARKLVFSKDNGGLDVHDLSKIFGSKSVNYVLKKYSASEAIDKLKAYEEKQKADEKIKVGDEVRAEDGTAVFVVTWMSENCICGVDLDGKCYSYEPREVCGKTGRKYSVGISDITRCTDDED